jgi:serine/threonine protein phosphatase PrpC
MTEGMMDKSDKTTLLYGVTKACCLYSALLKNLISCNMEHTLYVLVSRVRSVFWRAGWLIIHKVVAVNRKIRFSFVCGFLSCLCVMMEAQLPLTDASSDLSILRSFKSSRHKRKLQQQSEYERLAAVLEEQSPDLQKSFIENAGKILLGVKLKAADKKALQTFLKTVAVDADLNPADKKSINHFFKRGLSTGAKIGIGVGSAAAMAALVALVVAGRNGISRRVNGALEAFSGSGTGAALGAPVGAPTGTENARSGAHEQAPHVPYAGGGSDSVAGAGLKSVPAGAASRLSSSPVWVNPPTLYSDGTMHGHIKGPGGGINKVICPPDTVNGAGVGAHTEAGTDAGAGTGAGVGAVHEDGHASLTAEAGASGVSVAGAGAGAGGSEAAGGAAGSAAGMTATLTAARPTNPIEGTDHGATVRNSQKFVEYGVEHSIAAFSEVRIQGVAGGLAAYVGHEVNPRGAQDRIDRPDQDAFMVSISDGGVLRLAIADGAGGNNLSTLLLTGDSADWASVDYYLSSGGNAAQYLVNHFKQVNHHFNLWGGLFNECHTYLSANKESLSSALGILESPTSRGIMVDRAREQLQPFATAPYFGGMAAFLAVEINPRERKMYVANSGDTGMMVINRDGSMRHGPSLHPNLEGFARENGKTGIGYDADRIDCQTFEYDLDGTEDFCVCACDGFWDVFLGPNQLFPLSAAQKYQQEFVLGVRPSVNLSKWHSQAAIAQSRRTSAVLSKGNSVPFVLRQEYLDQHNSKHEPADNKGLTLEDVVTAIREEIQNGRNPSDKLKNMARYAGSSDDITVVVVDLSPLREASLDAAGGASTAVAHAGSGLGIEGGFLAGAVRVDASGGGAGIGAGSADDGGSDVAEVGSAEAGEASGGGGATADAVTVTGAGSGVVGVVPSSGDGSGSGVSASAEASVAESGANGLVTCSPGTVNGAGVGAHTEAGAGTAAGASATDVDSTAVAGGNGVVGQRIADLGVEGSESGPAVLAELGGSLRAARIAEVPAGGDAGQGTGSVVGDSGSVATGARVGAGSAAGATAGEAVRAEVASGDSRIGEAPAGADASVGAGVGDGSGSVAAGDGTGSDALVARGGAGTSAGAGAGAGSGVGAPNQELQALAASIGLPTTAEALAQWERHYKAKDYSGYIKFRNHFFLKFLHQIDVFFQNPSARVVLVRVTNETPEKWQWNKEALERLQSSNVG